MRSELNNLYGRMCERLKEYQRELDQTIFESDTLAQHFKTHPSPVLSDEQLSAVYDVPRTIEQAFEHLKVAHDVCYAQKVYRAKHVDEFGWPAVADVLNAANKDRYVALEKRFTRFMKQDF